MVTVELITLGKLKEPYLRGAMEEYGKRLSRFAQFSVRELTPIPLAENPSAGEIQAALEKEGEKIVTELKPGAFTIALCIEGKMLSSENFSILLEKEMAMGKSRFQFLIGSSYGLDEQVKKSADFQLSFSPMTFPHQLMRVLLTEQLYRSFSIIGHGKYHK